MKKNLDQLVREYLQVGNTNALCVYVGVEGSSCRRWKNGTNYPKGMHRVKVMYFLKKQGFSCAEFDALPAQIQTLGELIAEGTVAPERAVATIGFPRITDLLNVLLGRRSCNFERLGRIDALASDQSGIVAKGQKDRVAAVEQFAKLITEAVPLLDRMLSSEFSDGERAYARKTLGEFKLFNFSNKLDKLCGGKTLLQGQLT